MKEYDVAIIGGGAAGIMGALRGVLNNDRVLLFKGDAKSRKASRAQWVARVDNIPGFQNYKKGIVNPNKETLDFIKESLFSENLEVLAQKVTSIKKVDGRFELTTKDSTHIVDKVVLATGVMDVQPHINDSIQPILPYANVQLAEYCLRCDGHHVQNQDLAVIGHEDGAAWTGIILHERYDLKSVTILTNGETPNFSDDTKEMMEMYDFKIETSPIDTIEGNHKEKILESFTLKDGKVIHVQTSFVSLGMIIYNELAKDLGANLDKRGFVVTNVKGESSVEGFYAVGDIQADTKKQIYTSWDMAVDALDDINAKKRKRIRDEKLKQFRQGAN
jgi:thioredoxin reductase (NADPH)